MDKEIHQTDRCLVAYSRDGKLVDIYNSIPQAVTALEETTDSGLRAAIKTGKLYKDKFFKWYDIMDVPQTIEVEYLCKIDGQYFIKQIEVARYCGMSRQAVSAAVKAHAKTIGGKRVIWADEF